MSIMRITVFKCRGVAFVVSIIMFLAVAMAGQLQGCTPQTGLDVPGLQHSYPSPHATRSAATSPAPVPSPSATGTETDRVTAQIYYASSTKDPDVLKPEVTYPVAMTLKAAAEEELLKSIVKELIEGPPAEFKDKGFYTTLTPDTRLNSIKVEGDTVKVDFNDRINEGGGSCTMDQRRSQIENTLRNIPGHRIKKVIISVNGDSQNVLQP